jgi:hypothetical protein
MGCLRKPNSEAARAEIEVPVNRRHARRIASHVGAWLLVLLGITVLVIACSGWLSGTWQYGKTNAWEVVDRATIVMSYLLTTAAVYTAIQGMRKGGWLRKLLEREEQEALTQESREVNSRTDVLVMLYFNNKDLADRTIDVLEPQVVALLGSSNEDVAQYLKHLNGQKPKLVVITETIDDPDNAESAEARAAELIIRAQSKAVYAGCDPSKIVCDVTGTTKPMTFGMLWAAERLGIDTVYVRSKRENRQPIPGTQQVQYIRKFSR